jgi:hypothetical protein
VAKIEAAGTKFYSFDITWWLKHPTLEADLNEMTKLVQRK